MTQVYSGFDHCNQCWPAVVPGKVFQVSDPSRILTCLCPTHYEEHRVERSKYVGGQNLQTYEELPALRENGFWK